MAELEQRVTDRPGRAPRCHRPQRRQRRRRLLLRPPRSFRRCRRPWTATPSPATRPTNLHRLEQVVREAQLREDPAAEEWAFYLPLLREHADSTGRLPRSSHSLIDSVFGV